MPPNFSFNILQSSVAVFSTAPPAEDTGGNITNTFSHLSIHVSDSFKNVVDCHTKSYNDAASSLFCSFFSFT